MPSELRCAETVVVVMGDVPYPVASNCTSSTMIPLPLETILKPMFGLVTVCPSVQRTNFAVPGAVPVWAGQTPQLDDESDVYVVLSRVAETPPVQLTHWAKKLSVNAELAWVILCRHVPFAAVAVSVLAPFALLSNPVALRAAVTLVQVHALCVRSRERNARLVAPGSTSKPKSVCRMTPDGKDDQ